MINKITVRRDPFRVRHKTITSGLSLVYTVSKASRVGPTHSNKPTALRPSHPRLTCCPLPALAVNNSLFQKENKQKTLASVIIRRDLEETNLGSYVGLVSTWLLATFGRVQGWRCACLECPMKTENPTTLPQPRQEESGHKGKGTWHITRDGVVLCVGLWPARERNRYELPFLSSRV